MIGISERDDVEVARVEPGHVHGEVVGLRAAVDEVDALQGLRQSLGQAFGVLVDFRLKTRLFQFRYFGSQVVF